MQGRISVNEFMNAISANNVDVVKQYIAENDNHPSAFNLAFPVESEVHTADSTPQLPLFYALRLRHFDVASLLMNCTAVDVNAVNSEGKLIVDIVCKPYDTKAFKLVVTHPRVDILPFLFEKFDHPRFLPKASECEKSILVLKAALLENRRDALLFRNNKSESVSLNKMKNTQSQEIPHPTLHESGVTAMPLNNYNSELLQWAKDTLTANHYADTTPSVAEPFGALFVFPQDPARVLEHVNAVNKRLGLNSNRVTHAAFMNAIKKNNIKVAEQYICQNFHNPAVFNNSFVTITENIVIITRNKEKKSTPALYRAVKLHRNEIVAALLNIPGIDISQRNTSTFPYDYQPLQIAALVNNISAAEMLLQVSKASEIVNASTGNGSRIDDLPLIIAARRGHAEILKLLIDCPEISLRLGEAKHLSEEPFYASVRRMVCGEFTPLQYAIGARSLACVNVLLSAEGINVNAADITGCTALVEAYKSNQPAIMMALLQSVDLNFNPLLVYHICYHEMREVINEVLKAERTDAMKYRQLCAETQMKSLSNTESLSCGSAAMPPVSLATPVSLFGGSPVTSVGRLTESQEKRLGSISL